MGAKLTKKSLDIASTPKKNGKVESGNEVKVKKIEEDETPTAEIIEKVAEKEANAAPNGDATTPETQLEVSSTPACLRLGLCYLKLKSMEFFSFTISYEGRWWFNLAPKKNNSILL